MSKSVDYLQGFYDGFMAANKNDVPTQTPVPLQWPPETSKETSKCSVCGMDFGNKVWGYVCPHNRCPSKITSLSTMMGNTNE